MMASFLNVERPCSRLLSAMRSRWWIVPLIVLSGASPAWADAAFEKAYGGEPLVKLKKDAP